MGRDREHQEEEREPHRSMELITTNTLLKSEGAQNLLVEEGVNPEPSCPPPTPKDDKDVPLEGDQ